MIYGWDYILNRYSLKWPLENLWVVPAITVSNRNIPKFTERYSTSTISFDSKPMISTSIITIDNSGLPLQINVLLPF